MRQRSLESLFQRFASRGDARALGEVFDRAAPGLLALAGHLAPDPAQAQDLVLQAFLSAIEGARRCDPARPLMPWLVGFLVRGARHPGRRDGRRPRADGPGWMPAPPDPHDASERRELHAHLGAVLVRIPPSQREVLLRHLAGGQTPREIAAALGRAPGKVRGQIQRGLDRLRRLLPPAFALGTAAWPTRGPSALRAEVLAAAQASPAATADAKLPGGRTIVAAASVALLTGALLVRQHLAEAPAPPLAVSPALEEPRATNLVVAQRAPYADPASGGRPVVPAAEESRRVEGGPAAVRGRQHGDAPFELVLPPADTWLVRGRLTGDGPFDGTLAAVAVLRDGTRLATGTADFLGNYELEISDHVIDVNDERGLRIRVDHPDFAVAERTVTRSTSITHERGDPSRPARRVIDPRLELKPPRAWIDGRITPSTASTRVALFAIGTRGLPRPAPLDVASTRGGRYTLRAPDDGDFLLVALAERWLPASATLRIEATGPPRVAPEPIELSRGRELVIQVRLPAGLPAQGCKVELRPTGVVRTRGMTPGQRRRGAGLQLLFEDLVWSERGILRRRHEAQVDRIGGGMASTLPAVDLLARVLGTPGLGPEDDPGQTRIPADAFDALLTPRVARQRFQVLDGGGAVPHARVVISSSDTVDKLLTDEAGEASLLLPAEQSFGFAVEAPGHRIHRGWDHAPAPGQDELRGVRLELAPTSLGRVVLRPDLPVERLLVLWWEPGQEQPHLEDLAVVDGEAHLDWLPEGELLLEVLGPEFDAERLEIRVEEGATIEVDLVSTQESILGLMTSGLPPGPKFATVLDDAGRGLELAYRPVGMEGYRPRESAVRAPLPDVPQVETSRPLAPGRYLVLVSAWDGELLWASTIEVSAGRPVLASPRGPVRRRDLDAIGNFLGGMDAAAVKALFEDQLNLRR